MKIYGHIKINKNMLHNYIHIYNITIQYNNNIVQKE